MRRREIGQRSQHSKFAYKMQHQQYHLAAHLVVDTSSNVFCVETRKLMQVGCEQNDQKSSAK